MTTRLTLNPEPPFRLDLTAWRYAAARATRSIRGMGCDTRGLSKSTAFRHASLFGKLHLRMIRSLRFFAFILGAPLQLTGSLPWSGVFWAWT